jgi:alpha-tubulin suppressor-like RCC1 family protein/5-hydroxyisourate hydrolase-like protein (transthyretin family)
VAIAVQNVPHSRGTDVTKANRRRAALLALVAGIGLLVACQPAGAVLYGRLTEVGTGMPAAGAAVRVYSASSETVVAQTVANADGRYQFLTSALPNGTYRLRFSAADWWNGGGDWSTATDVVVSAATPLHIDVPVTPSLGTLQGEVHSDEGGILGGATVQAVSTRTGEVIATTTQPVGGPYRFESLAAGSYVVRASAPGYAPGYADNAVTSATAWVVVVNPGATTNAPSVWIEHEGLLHGTVTTAAGTPLAGMLVTARITGSTEVASLATSAADGTFTLGRLNPVGHTLTVSDPTGARPTVTVNDGTRNLNLTPGAFATLQLGRVEMATGRLTAPLPPVPLPAAGAQVTCALGTNGGIGCWGDNLSTKAIPPPDKDFTTIESSFTQTCGLTIEARVWCNGAVQPLAGTFVAVDPGPAYMGCGITTRAALDCWGTGALATPPAGTYAALSLGASHGCAIARDGTLRCWGSNGSGESSPPSGTFSSVSSGSAFSCAIATDATLHCWGSNAQGQRTGAPTGTYVAVSAGGSHACALATDATVHCWGANTLGQAAAPAGTFVALSAGGGHTCATATDGQMSCWGENTFGESTVPTPVQGIAVGGLHACRILGDATLRCWGQNVVGQASPPGGPFTSIAAGLDNSCAIATDDTLHCWGYDGSGESTPPPGTYSAVDLSISFGCAVATDGTLRCWGASSYGETTPPPGTYTSVSVGLRYGCALATDATLRCWGDNTSGKATPPPGTFTAVNAGANHACAIATDGTLRCWGANSLGATTPPPGTYTSLSGSNNTCAVATDGTVRCWGGGNTYGENTVPPGTYTAVSAGSGATCAIRSDGHPVCWGRYSISLGHIG